MRKLNFSRLTEDRGVALPVALAVLFSVAGLATGAARAGIVCGHRSSLASNSDQPARAATAGLSAAIYQTNLMQPGGTQCVIKNASTGALSNAAVTNGWCAVQSEDLGDGVTYQMQVSGASTSTSSAGLIL